MMEHWGAIAGWAVDFMRAARERPRWARLALPVVLGRHAYREFIGLQDMLALDGHNPYFGYGLERMSYHRDWVPSNWWEERDPRTLKEPSVPPPAPAPAQPAPIRPEIVALVGLVDQHNTHVAREQQAFAKLSTLDGEFIALVNVAVPQMLPEQQAQFHQWMFRRHLVFEEVTEAIGHRKADFEKLHAAVNQAFAGG